MNSSGIFASRSLDSIGLRWSVVETKRLQQYPRGGNCRTRLEAMFHGLGGMGLSGVRRALDIIGEKTMKSAIVLATVIAAVALGACRKEVRHEPMKLGADVTVERVAQ